MRLITTIFIFFFVLLHGIRAAQEGGSGMEKGKATDIVADPKDATTVAPQNENNANTESADGAMDLPMQVPGVDYDPRFWRPSTLFPHGLVWLGVIPPPGTDMNMPDVSTLASTETTTTTTAATSCSAYPTPSDNGESGSTKKLDKGKGRAVDDIDVDETAKSPNPAQLFDQLSAEDVALIGGTTREEQELLFRTLKDIRAKSEIAKAQRIVEQKRKELQEAEEILLRLNPVKRIHSPEFDTVNKQFKDAYGDRHERVGYVSSGPSREHSSLSDSDSPSRPPHRQSESTSYAQSLNRRENSSRGIHPHSLVPQRMHASSSLSTSSRPVYRAGHPSGGPSHGGPSHADLDRPRPRQPPPDVAWPAELPPDQFTVPNAGTSQTSFASIDSEEFPGHFDMPEDNIERWTMYEDRVAAWLPESQISVDRVLQEARGEIPRELTRLVDVEGLRLVGLSLPTEGPHEYRHPLEHGSDDDSDEGISSSPTHQGELAQARISTPQSFSFAEASTHDPVARADVNRRNDILRRWGSAVLRIALRERSRQSGNRPRHGYPFRSELENVRPEDTPRDRDWRRINALTPMLAPNVLVNPITDEVLVGPRAAEAARAAVENRPWPPADSRPRGKRPRLPARGWPDSPGDVEELVEIIRRTEPRSVEATWLLWTFCMMARAQHPARRDWTMWYALRIHAPYASESAARFRLLDARDGIPDHRDIGRMNPADPSRYFNDWMEEQIQLHHPSSTNPTAGLVFNRANWLYIPSALAYFTMANTAMKWTDRYPRGEPPRDRVPPSGKASAGPSHKHGKRKGNNSSEACTKRYRSLFIELIAIPWNARRIASLWNQRPDNAGCQMLERLDIRPVLRRMDERFHMNTGVEEVLSHLLHCGISFDLLDSFYAFGVEYLYHRLQKTDNGHWLDIDRRRLDALRNDGGLRLPRPMSSIDSWFSGGVQDVLRAASVYWSELLGRRSPSMGTTQPVDRFREPRTIALRRALAERTSTAEQSALPLQHTTPQPATIGNGVYWYLGGAAPVRGRVRPRGDEPFLPVVDSMFLFCNWTVPPPEPVTTVPDEDTSMADPDAGPSGSTDESGNHHDSAILPPIADQPAPGEDSSRISAAGPSSVVLDSAAAVPLPADQPAVEAVPLVADQPVFASTEDENSSHSMELPGIDMEVEN